MPHALHLASDHPKRCSVPSIPLWPLRDICHLRWLGPLYSSLTFCQAEVKFAKSGLPYGSRIWSANPKCGLFTEQIFTKWMSLLTERMIPICSCLRLQWGVTYLMHAIKSASISHKYSANHSLLACCGLALHLRVCRATVHAPAYYLLKGHEQGPPC